MRRGLSRIAVALALLVGLAAIFLFRSHRDEREYGAKIEDYEKGESEYAKLARTTGGEHLFLAPDTDLSAFLGETGLEEVIWRQIGTLDGKGEVGIFVDPSVRKLGLSIQGSSSREDSGFALSAVEPGGRHVEGEAEGVRATLTRNGAIYVVEAPAPGTWRLSFAGHGSYQLAAKAESDLSWEEARFVTLGGRPGHGGWFPLSGRLQAGKEHTFEARLAGTLPQRPRISLVDQFGAELEKAAFLSFDDDHPGIEILGRVTVPDRAFRFLLRAGDVQRVFDELFDSERSQQAYAWTYRSSTPEADCAVVDFLLLTAQGTREIDQVLWSCVRNQTATGVTITASANLLIAAADFPEASGSVSFEALNRLGNGPLELSPEDCESYAALLGNLSADTGEGSPPPVLRATCAASGASARLRLVVTPAPSGR